MPPSPAGREAASGPPKNVDLTLHGIIALTSHNLRPVAGTKLGAFAFRIQAGDLAVGLELAHGLERCRPQGFFGRMVAVARCQAQHRTLMYLRQIYIAGLHV